MNAIPLLVLLAVVPKDDPKALFSSILKSEAKSEVTPSMVCMVQHAIKRKKTVPWTKEVCTTMASDFSKVRERGVPPILAFSMAINESDLRPDSSSLLKYRAYPFYFHGKKKLKVQDHGLMGVRCVEDQGVCINGPAKGLTPKELREPSTNINVGVSVLIRKKHLNKVRAWEDARLLNLYNGNTGAKDNGYADRIIAITAALYGIQLEVKTARMKMLTNLIISAVNEAPPMLASR